MAVVIVTTRVGEEHHLELRPGPSLMELIRDAAITESFAICGGNCSCATCHVYIEPAFSEMIPEMSEEEYELLDFSNHREETSRLACQIPLTVELAGLSVRIADAS